MQPKMIRLRQMELNAQTQELRFVQNVYVRPDDVLAVYERPMQIPGTTDVNLVYSVELRTGESFFVDSSPLEIGRNDAWYLDVSRLGRPGKGKVSHD